MLKIPTSYTKDNLDYTRVTPAFTAKTEDLIKDIVNNNFKSNWVDNSYAGFAKPEVTVDLFKKFKEKFLSQISASHNNNFTGLDSFANIDICLGCTQYIDNLYLHFGQEHIQVLEGEYRYHFRMYPNTTPVTLETLDPTKQLIISLPFVNGLVHHQMLELLDKCASVGIPVHLDCAWLTASKNINFDFSHPAIASVGVSMSKGYGTGWNRIGLRLQRTSVNDSIKIMNDFNMFPAILVCVAEHFLNHLDMDHLWDTHEQRYYKICKDFNLTPTNAIHSALDGNSIVGVSGLIRYLEVNA